MTVSVFAAIARIDATSTEASFVRSALVVGLATHDKGIGLLALYSGVTQVAFWTAANSLMLFDPAEGKFRARLVFNARVDATQIPACFVLRTFRVGGTTGFNRGLRLNGRRVACLVGISKVAGRALTACCMQTCCA